MRRMSWTCAGLLVLGAGLLRPAPAQDGPPAGWPPYLKEFKLPAGRTWSQYRVRAKDGMPQALIPAGESQMGAVPGDTWAQKDEKPRAKVTLSAYWIDLHPVTNAQYGRFVAEARHQAGKDWPKWSSETSPRHPAVYVSWDDAMAYARWAGATLPTEAQWEKAARGGKDGLRYPWGNDPDPTKANGNWEGERERAKARQYTEAVGRYPANGYGLYDMAGNVWQWCRDWYTEAWYDKLPERDPENTTPGDFRVCRGGSWADHTEINLRVSRRIGYMPEARPDCLGFRCSESVGVLRPIAAAGQAGPLHRPAADGDLAAVKDLLDKGADVNAKTRDGDTPLHAALGGFARDVAQVVQLLLDKGADPSAKNSRGVTPLQLGVSRWRSESVKALLAKGAAWAPFHVAAFLGHVKVVADLLDKGADANAQDDAGVPVLFAAVLGGQVTVVKLLLERGAKVSAQDKHGMTALQGAAKTGRIEVARLLLDKGAGVNDRGNNGFPPLHSAAGRGHAEMVKFLLDRGANIDGRSRDSGMTALHEAVLAGDFEMAKLLVEKGADINAQDDQGSTALALAAHTCPALVAWVKARGTKAAAGPAADPEITTTFKDLPLADIVQSLSERSQVPITLGEGADPQRRMSGSFSQPLSKVLAVLAAVYGLQVRRQGTGYVLVGKSAAEPVAPAATDDEVSWSTGGIYLSTWKTSAEFRHVRFTSGGRELVNSDVPGGWPSLDGATGTWRVDGEVLRQSDTAGWAGLGWPDFSVADATLEYEARALAGETNFKAAFRSCEAGSYQLVFYREEGAVGLIRWLKEYRSALVTSVSTPFRVETGRWYPVRIEIQGTRTRCVVNGQLVASIDEAFYVPPADEQARQLVWVSDLRPLASTNGSGGPIRRDRVNLNGRDIPITLRGQRFAKGVGVHAPSDVKYRLTRPFTRFRAEVGTADTASRFVGSVVFIVEGDGRTLFTSNTLVGGGPTALIDVDVTGVKELVLRCTDAGDGNNNDHAVWAGARLLR